MIARMLKVFVVARNADRERLLAGLARLGVVHIVPVDPSRAKADPETAAAIERFQRAIQILEGTEARGQPPAIDAAGAAAEALRIQRQSAERSARLSTLYHKLNELAVWGDVRLDDLRLLGEAGVGVHFFVVPTKALGEVRGECVHAIRPLPGRRTLVAVVTRGGEAAVAQAGSGPSGSGASGSGASGSGALSVQAPDPLITGDLWVPPNSEPLPLPERDRPSLRAEAAEIDAALKADADELASLTQLLPAMREELGRLRQEAAWAVAMRSALDDPVLYALQGWAPEEAAAAISSGLDSAGLDAAVQTSRPGPDDDPPTLIRYPRWVRPIEGLFRILSIFPGYREIDVSGGFMIALPIFCAMLIGDGGYGLLFILLPTIFYRKVAASMGREVAQLLIIIGFCTLVWGIITASYFGFGPVEMKGSGGLLESLGNLLGSLQVLSVEAGNKDSFNRLMRICFIMGAVHLSAAHLWRAKCQWPDPRFLNNVGWAIVLWGTFGLINLLLLKDRFDWNTPFPYLLITGGVLVVAFADPGRNVAKSLAVGLFGSLLPAIATLSDILSYIRLMAVGLAGSVLAVSFNNLALQAGVLGIFVLVFGHTLNIGLCLIALFAHGVRLNVLEFSSNAGMEWSGYPYEPFSKKVEEN